MDHLATLDQVACGQISGRASAAVDNGAEPGGGRGQSGERSRGPHPPPCDAGGRSLFPPGEMSIFPYGAFWANGVVRFRQTGRPQLANWRETGIVGLAKAKSVVQNDDVPSSRWEGMTKPLVALRGSCDRTES